MWYTDTHAGKILINKPGGQGRGREFAALRRQAREFEVTLKLHSK